jgi:hypothetical protein
MWGVGPQVRDDGQVGCGPFRQRGRVTGDAAGTHHGERGKHGVVQQPLLVQLVGAGGEPGPAPVEHGFAHFKSWRAFTKLRTDPARATQPLRALLALTNLEVNR